MASLAWGKVYFRDAFAGILREEPGGGTVFSYDAAYLGGGHPAVAHTLPLTGEPHACAGGLHPFFDNLVAEGWLEDMQKRLLGRRQASRFELLLAFGLDCAGAVSVVDQEAEALPEGVPGADDPKERRFPRSRATLSGVQPKFGVVAAGGAFRVPAIDELSTHIAKFASAGHPDIIENEYLTTRAFKALLPDDDVADLEIGRVEGIDEPALLAARFDRTQGPGGLERLHFEEFTQLLGRSSDSKYDGAHADMARFILETDGCLPAQNYTLFRRVLAGLLLGNTDMHLKNFAMYHTPEGLRFTPSYDQVAASHYGYKQVALAIAGARDLEIGSLKPRHLALLGEEFGLSPEAVAMAAAGLERNLKAAKRAIAGGGHGSDDLKGALINLMEKRWNGTFALIGRQSSKPR